MKKLLLLSAAVLLLAGCKNEEITIDPEDVITLDMSNKDANLNNAIAIKDGNFVGIIKLGDYRVLFLPLGKVKGLGHITSIPKTGWVTTTAAINGEGYIALVSDGVRFTTYYRIFVDDTDINRKVVKCQYPFFGL
jgi:hypothetical protein